ncbi:glycosyltransferase involved in cell wall biosynthesis [Lutibacter oceani]|uniref:Glycosyltransferase involved in cell wall biosynthesis n=1 Tax=Lutibacter oceani TaxID=1853311 RepID=A0A3D9S2J3_9FLAO|nr:glycosyltransferase [Lutibacter oceani]REE83085.1 glycosyltransferase involved in cell wall biosynthesis [Lutibacter oceani]
MKVLQVINSLNTGGAEKLVLETLPLYNKKGIAMDLLVLDGANYPFLKTLKKQQCCKIYSLTNKSIYNPFLIFKIIPYFKKYDVIHVHLFPALYWVAFASMLNLKKPKIIYTEHNTTNTRRSSAIFRLVDKFIYKRYTKIVTISKEVDLNLRSHLNFKPSKFKLINNGINLKNYKNVNPNPKNIFFTEHDKILIQVSSFTEQKDQATLIKSLTELPNYIKLLLVGEGELKPECEALVKKLQLTSRVQFLGIRMDVPQLLKTADIIILSSYHEGLSLSSIEGMASGKPFIASDAPGLTDVVKGAGLLFSVGDAQSLAKQIMKLLNDENYYNEVANACLERSKKYDIQMMVEKHIGFYKTIT